MSILSYKYKAHKFINYIFYIIVFLIGFVIGFGSEKIDFNKLTSQVLMIENVSAAIIDDYNTFDEEFIYNSFSLNSDFDISEYPYIGCKYYKLNSYPTLYCFALNKNDLENATYTTGTTGGLRNVTISGLTGFYYFNYRVSNSSYVNSSTYNTNTTLTGIYTQEGNIHSWVRANFDFPGITDSNYQTMNILDFSEYSVNLEFNENLFKDNPDFKEVCVDSSKKFAITSTTLSDINSVYDYDYIWFPYGVSGLSKFLYDSSVETKEVHYTEEEAKQNYYFISKDVIDNYFDSDIPGLELELKDYTDRYSYYGYSAFPFRMYYSDTDYQFNIFWFEEPYKIYMEDGIGAVIPNLKFDDEIEDDNKYCFYIKNQYEVTYVNTNEFNDYYGTVPTPNGDLNFETSYMESQMDSGSLMSQVNNFIEHISDTIDFIKENIYSFYLSLPLLVRMFLISLFVILIVKFIIGMVVR